MSLGLSAAVLSASVALAPEPPVPDPFATGQEAPASEPAPAPAPAQVAPAPASSGVGPAPAPGPAVLDPDLERRNEFKGAGTALAVVSVATMAGTVAFQFVHANTVGRCLDSVQDEPGTLNIEFLAQCERQGLGLRWGARLLQPTTVVLGLVAGGRLGKGYAYTDAALGRPPQNTAAYAGGGAGLFGLGLLSYVVTRVVFMRDSYKNRCAHIGYSECARYNQFVIDGSADLSVIAMTYGGMMMTYGTSYGRTKRRLALTVTPDFTRNYAGALLTKQF